MIIRKASDITTAAPVTASVSDLIRNAVALITERRIADIVVIDGGKVVEILDTNDLVQRGYL